MALWSAATGLRASPTCAASPRQQEQEEARWRRIRSGVERSDRKNEAAEFPPPHMQQERPL